MGTENAEREVVDLCSELIRIDSSNYGDGSGPGERKAAEYVAGKLADVGLDVVMHESAPGRTSLVARSSSRATCSGNDDGPRSAGPI